MRTLAESDSQEGDEAETTELTLINHGRHQPSTTNARNADCVHNPGNMGLDPTNHRLYVASAQFGPVPAGGRRGPVIAGSFAILVIEQ